MINKTTFTITVNPKIPPRLSRLEELANNLWYSWDRSTRTLFSRIDPRLWEAIGHNPKSFLKRVDESLLLKAASDQTFLAIRDSLLQIVDRDLCEAHAEDHAELSTKVQEIVCALDPQRTVVLLRELDGLLRRWLENHIQMHDLVVARWMQREAAMFGQGPESAG